MEKDYRLKSKNDIDEVVEDCMATMQGYIERGIPVATVSISYILSTDFDDGRGAQRLFCKMATANTTPLNEHIAELLASLIATHILENNLCNFKVAIEAIDDEALAALAADE